MQQKRNIFVPGDQPVTLREKRSLFLKFINQFNGDILIDLSKEPLEKYKAARCPEPILIPFNDLGQVFNNENILQQLQLKESLENWARTHNLNKDWIIEVAYRTLGKWTSGVLSMHKWTSPGDPITYFVPNFPPPIGYPEYHYVHGETRIEYIHKIKQAVIKTFMNSPLLVPSNSDFPESQIECYIKKVVLPAANKYCLQLEQQTKEWGFKKARDISEEDIKYTALRYAKRLSFSKLAKELDPERHVDIEGAVKKQVLRTVKILDLPPFPIGKQKGTKNTSNVHRTK